MKVSLGPLPPPIGGVTIHLLRLRDVMKEEIIDSKCYTFKKILHICNLSKCNIYVHDYRRTTLIILCIKQLLINKGCRLFLVNHNYALINNSRHIRSYKGHMIRFLISRSKFVYHVNECLLDSFRKKYPNVGCGLLNPFIPPVKDSFFRLEDHYGEKAVSFINSTPVLITAGAWRLNFDNGLDLYGFDMLISLMEYLVDEVGPNVGLFFGLADAEYNKKYVEQCFKMIKTKRLENSVFVLTGQQDLWPAISKASLFIRPTTTDGDPISIREALYFSVPVIASDCTKRDEHVFLFESRNQMSLNKAVIDMLKSKV